ncbi:MAG TPA: hypothetical protein DF427_01040 [Moraxellaceae bacterium]|nr:hypothetical protein [Moraxellaceae bacterium]
MKIRRSPEITAQLLLINAKLYEKEREKEITRLRISVDTLRRISGRTAIREKFKEDLEEELLELGWIFIQLDNEFAIMEKKRLQTWVRLSSKRLKDQGLLSLDSDCSETVQARFDDLIPAPEEESLDE